MKSLEKITLALTLLSILQVSLSAKLDKSQRIVGGVPADIADFPFQLALLDMVRGVHGNYMCGASNIHRLWALTAAHCVDFNTPPALMFLRGGSTSRLTGGGLFSITRYVLHPGYNRQTIDLDIAIIEVSSATPLEGFSHVTPIPIPPICNTNCCGVCPEGPPITVAGWGALENGSLPEHLRQVDKDIIPNDLCNQYWSTFPIPISHSKFCTRVENGRDSCNGDSGSPITRAGVQVGLVSFGSQVCGDGSLPAVYVRLEEPTVRNFIAGFVSV